MIAEVLNGAIHGSLPNTEEQLLNRITAGARSFPGKFIVAQCRTAGWSQLLTAEKSRLIAHPSLGLAGLARIGLRPGMTAKDILDIPRSRTIFPYIHLTPQIQLLDGLA